MGASNELEICTVRVHLPRIEILWVIDRPIDPVVQACLEVAQQRGVESVDTLPSCWKQLQQYDPACAGLFSPTSCHHGPWCSQHKAGCCLAQVTAAHVLHVGPRAAQGL
jgi:hypothetical protein